MKSKVGNKHSGQSAVGPLHAPPDMRRRRKRKSGKAKIPDAQTIENKH